jgi:hypothetical protein
MNLAADMGRHSGRATPSLLDAPYRQFEEATGRRSTYPLPIPVQTNPATSLLAFGGSRFPEVTRYQPSLWLKPVSD